MPEIRINPLYCDWVWLPLKDRRKGNLWMCRECKHRAKGKNVPQCPSREIVIPSGNTNTR